MKNFLLLMLFLVFIVSTIVIILILSYIEPQSSNKIIIISFLISFILSISTFFAFILYFIKKVHYRGQVLLNHVNSSFRQGLFISIFFIGIGIFERIQVPIYFAGFLFFILLLFLELFIQNIYG